MKVGIIPAVIHKEANSSHGRVIKSTIFCGIQDIRTAFFMNDLLTVILMFTYLIFYVSVWTENCLYSEAGLVPPPPPQLVRKPANN
jgi:hypothetical protein